MDTPPPAEPTQRTARPRPVSSRPNDELQARIGINLRRMRQESGLTVVDIGRIARVTHQYVTRIENGQKNPTLSVLKRVAAAVGQDVDALFRPLEPPT